jgi:5,6-dimethylbenzimidazole synthase
MANEETERGPPDFDAGFAARFRDLVLWRRDVRRFRTDPVAEPVVKRLVELASHAPSVGHCQPWRFVLVGREDRRALVRASFARANVAALDGYQGEEKALYARLKLEGLDRAPVHLAVFADEGTEDGAGLGRQTMPEALKYSVVGAVHTLWLAARAEGLGMGWISILEPDVVTSALDVPSGWGLVAYLCLGYPEEKHLDPELVRHGWQPRLPLDDIFFTR